MKRDMDLIREILLDIEKVPAGGFWDVDAFAVNRDRNEVLYTLRIMEQHSMVSECTSETMDGLDFVGNAVFILPAGYDFLDASRNNTVWKKFKDKVKNEGISFTFSIAIKLLKKLAEESVLG